MAKNTDEKLNIQEAIKAFSKDDISKAGINLFSILGYDTSLQAPLDKKTFAEFKEDYIEASPAADRFSEEKALTDEWKKIDILFQLTDDSFTGQQQLFDSKLNPLNPQSYLCFAIELKRNEYSKTQIAGITREVNKLFSIPIIIVFKYGECITLAIINRRVNKRDSDRDVLEKVTLIKDIVFEKPHRAHIEILYDMSLAQLSADYTIINFESLHKAWSEVLDTQTLNKRFYTELSNWYFWAIKTVVYPGYEMEAARGSLFTKEEKVREHNAKNLIRLLTRLLFVWFIKEKDLIPEELFDESKIKKIISKFEPGILYDVTEVVPETKSIYYKAILQNLFFASLNAEHGKRAFRIDGQNQNATSLMRYQRYHKNPEAFVKLIESKVPFMNGGLFECLDHQDDELKGKNGGAIIDYEDGFSDRKDNELFVPDYVFFGKDVKVDLSTEYDDKKKKDVTVNGIINILHKYKFTIAENTPVEEDIALDPELLGRVFENLLASYNPETKTNARKQTGSFYTPRPIVEYMVDESLKAYLKTKIKDAALSKGTLEDKTKAVEEIEKSLDSKLDNLIAYNESEPEFSEAERFQILKYIDECKILDPACGSGAFPMGILQKMVYVIHKLDPQNDNWKQIQIQKISNDSKLNTKEKNELQKELLTVFDENELDYARKLYLIENCIHGIDIQPIATQISRLRFFISLIVDQKVDGNKANFGVRPLPNLENRFVTANSLIGLNDEQAYLSSKEIDELMLTLQKVRHDLFKAKTPKHKFELRQEDKRIRDELEQELLKLGFGKENAKLISTWDPYDKNRSAEFFDAEWMFGIKDGFDIVIGNPPYIKELGNEHVFSKVNNTHFGQKYHAGKMDYWFYFMHKGIELLKTNGIITFITSRYWINSSGAKKLIRHIKNEMTFIDIVDIGNLTVFENVVGYHMISELRKTKKIEICSYKKLDDNVNNIQEGIFAKQIPIPHNELFSENDEIIFEKRENNSALTLNDVCSVFQGVVEASDKISNKMYKRNPDPKHFVNEGIFVLSEDEYKALNLTSEEKEIIELYEDEGCINRYYTDYNKTRHLIYSDALNRDKIENNSNFKNLKSHLDYMADYITSTYKPYGLHRARVHDDFIQKKLIGPSMFGKPNFTYDDKNLFVGMSYNVIISKNSTNLLFILALLNSSYANDWFYKNAKHRGVGVDVGVDKLRTFPIPKTNSEEQEPIIKLVENILAAKKANNNEDTSEFEEQIDKLVNELYGSSE